MAKTSSNQDRRARVEQLRREQRRAEKRRSYAIVAGCVVVGLVIVGLGAYPLIRQNAASSGELATLGVPASRAGCAPLRTEPAKGNQQHKPVGTDIFYPDAPPAFGPHYPTTAPFERKFYTADDRPRLEYLVHNLEHGYNLLWYDDTVAKDSDELAVVKGIASKFEGGRMTDKFIALPWTSEDGKPFPDGKHLALTHWSAGGDPSDPSQQVGVWKYCARPSGEVVSSFVEDYPYTDSPEPQAM